MSSFEVDSPAEAQLSLEKRFLLINGEKAIDYYHFIVGEVRYYAFITNWAVRLVYDDPNTIRHDETIPLKCISHIKKVGGRKRLGFYGIEVMFSTVAIHKFAFNPELDHRPRFYKSLTNAIKSPLELPQNRWYSTTNWVGQLVESSHNNWDVIPNEFCRTYPEFLVKPKAISLEVVKECASYRSKGRIPFLSYVHANGAVLLRSSQPLTGIISNQSTADQQFISAACQDHPIKIFDCRPKLNAVANKLKGGGYEKETYYTDEFTFLSIPNIHKVRDMYISINASPGDPENKWGSIILLIIQGSKLVAQALAESNACLIHCTDGWDRTAQVASLVQIFVEPESRTISGLWSLIAKEWCDSGHMFGLRCGHSPLTKPDESAPVFLQFLDCVAQIMRQRPNAFEFTLKFLELIAFHSYAQLFGDFLFTNYQDRSNSLLPPSLWNNFEEEPVFAELFKNVNYQPEGDISNVEVPTYHMTPELLCPCIPGGWLNIVYPIFS